MFLINITAKPGDKLSAPGNSRPETFSTFPSLLHSIILLTLPTSQLIGNRPRKAGVLLIAPGLAKSLLKCAIVAYC